MFNHIIVFTFKFILLAISLVILVDIFFRIFSKWVENNKKVFLINYFCSFCLNKFKNLNSSHVNTLVFRLDKHKWWLWLRGNPYGIIFSHYRSFTLIWEDNFRDILLEVIFLKSVLTNPLLWLLREKKNRTWRRKKI